MASRIQCLSACSLRPNPLSVQSSSFIDWIRVCRKIRGTPLWFAFNQLEMGTRKTTHPCIDSPSPPIPLGCSRNSGAARTAALATLAASSGFGLGTTGSPSAPTLTHARSCNKLPCICQSCRNVKGHTPCPGKSGNEQTQQPPLKLRTSHRGKAHACTTKPPHFTSPRLTHQPQRTS